VPETSPTSPGLTASAEEEKSLGKACLEAAALLARDRPREAMASLWLRSQVSLSLSLSLRNGSSGKSSPYERAGRNEESTVQPRVSSEFTVE